MLVGYCKLQENFQMFKEECHYYQGRYSETTNDADFHAFMRGQDQSL